MSSFVLTVFTTITLLTGLTNCCTSNNVGGGGSSEGGESGFFNCDFEFVFFGHLAGVGFFLLFFLHISYLATVQVAAVEVAVEMARWVASSSAAKFLLPTMERRTNPEGTMLKRPTVRTERILKSLTKKTYLMTKKTCMTIAKRFPLLRAVVTTGTRRRTAAASTTAITLLMTKPATSTELNDNRWMKINQKPV